MCPWKRNPFACTSSSFNGEGNGNPLQYSCLENPMDGGAWWAAVHGVARSQTQLSNFTFTFHFHALEKAMATHSSVLAWRIPGTGEPCGLPSMGSHRIIQDWCNLAAAASSFIFYMMHLMWAPNPYPVSLRLVHFTVSKNSASKPPSSLLKQQPKPPLLASLLQP